MADMSTDILPTDSIDKSSKERQRVRVAQRRPLACRACTNSKVRCDKTSPCGRCHKRGIQCTREVVVLSTLSLRRKKDHHSSLKPQSRQDLGTASVIPAGFSEHSESRDKNCRDDSHHPDQAFNDCPQIRSQSQYMAHGSLSDRLDLETSELHNNSPSPSFTLPTLTTRLMHDVRNGASKASQSRPFVQPAFEDLATGIEGLAWGRHQCHRYPHRACMQMGSPSETARMEAQSDGFLERLPDATIARELIDFHIRYLRWNHNVLHVPTFLNQCEEFWSSGTAEDGQWLALYCAVLSSAAWSFQTCPEYVDNVVLASFTQTANELFNMAMDALDDHKFMSRHTIFSLQAVCISSMVGNVLGKSDLLTTIVHACVRIGQCLGLHRILDEDKEDTWDEIVEKEVGRRVWWKLVEIDYHSMPYTGTCCINPRQFTTKPPLNCNDEDLQEQDKSCLTTSTYSIIMAKIALLIPDLLDGISTLDDMAKRYEHVIDVDRRMRKLVAEIPTVILRNDDADFTRKTEWLAIARRTLAIAAADKIIMIHRSFLLKSFRSPVYLFTRTTCVSAAMTILREHEQIARVGSRCPPIWVHSAFCVTAIVVIFLNLLYCHASMTQATKDQHHTLISKARTRLSRHRNDTMARRGVLLIDAMLDEDIFHLATQGAPHSSSRPEFHRILNRFLQRDQEGTHMPTSIPDSYILEPGLCNQVEDFDMWYHQMFDVER